MEMPPDPDPPPPTRAGQLTGLVDLAGKRLGGMVVAASDEFFGAKENLLEPTPPTFDPDAYTDHGKVMDGWETRRRRTPGHDWCLIRLGVPGIVRAVIVDTSHFTGNYPEAFDLDGWAADAQQAPSAEAPQGSSAHAAAGIDPGAGAGWVPLVPRTDLRGDAVARVEVDRQVRVTHVRLRIHPDGGVARLRVLGQPLVDLRSAVDAGDRLDLAALVHGGRAIGCSDAHYSAPSNMIMLGDARDMRDGWETRRRRGPGADWAVIALATTGVVERVEVDTTHFKGNHPDRCRIDVRDAPGWEPDRAGEDGLAAEGWTTLVAERPLGPHARHTFSVDRQLPATHLRIVAIPDGGVARLRVYGQVTTDGWRRAGLRLVDAMHEPHARSALHACCGSGAWVWRMLQARPFGTPEALFATAEQAWADLSQADQLEAFAAHPRIGERSTSAWSGAEQAGTADADADVRRRLAAGNAAYEERFGFVFLIRAAGRSAAEMLEALEERLGHDRDTELAVAAEQQRQIMGLRLERLLVDGPEEDEGP